MITGDQTAVAVDTRCNQAERAVEVFQALFLHRQLAVGNAGVQGVQLAVVELGTTYHQVGVGGVDEAGAIDGDAVRIGQHVIGCPAKNFLGAVQGRSVAADYFVEDDAGRMAPQLRVGRQMPGKLGLAVLQGVVQYHALAVDVVVEKLVMGQTAGVGRDDIEDGHAGLIL